MHTNRSISLVVLAFLLLTAFCFPGSAFSQNSSGNQKPLLKFANLDITKSKTATYQQVLANPQFVCSDGWEVLYFTLSFEPKGKDFIGPYATKGDKLTEKEIDIFKKLKASGVETIRVFLENVKAAGPDKQVRTIVPFIFTINN